MEYKLSIFKDSIVDAAARSCGQTGLWSPKAESCLRFCFCDHKILNQERKGVYGNTVAVEQWKDH